MMDVENFLLDKLKNSAITQLSQDDQKLLRSLGLTKYLFAKLKSKKFRKFKIDQKIEEEVLTKIQKAVDNNNPIPFVFPFGGYKHYSISTFPYADWAEFFFLSYYIEYISQVALVYDPGTILYILSDDAAIEIMDNVPNEFQEKYIVSLNKLIYEFAKYIPTNIKIQIVRTVPDLYKTHEEYYSDLETYSYLGKEAVAKLTPEKYERRVVMSDFNILWKGKQDWSVLNEDEKLAKKIRGMTMHDTVIFLPKRAAVVRNDTNILLFPSMVPNALPIGTTKTSMAKFWVGYGALEDRGNEYQERILSPSQYDNLENKLSKNKLNIFDAQEFPGLQEISIYSGELNYKFE